ncbi:translation factor pelota [Rhizodiscina lignyota]|uniref:Protein DOM34 homolog n=1 Tax=Rhizodiscina lignyota TaxID=1504668 RepID=A0A9P4M5J9_9PEZI|nr:translation factor pelota [Rhizodiscina lignyota]
MRLIKNNIIQRDGSGSVTLCPEVPEDMWHAYNLIRPTDILRANTIRRVVTKQSATGTTSSERMHVTLTIRVKSTDFDTSAGQLHISGIVASENQHVGLGQHHTLDLELHRNFTLEKADGWDSIAIEILKESVKTGNTAQLWAVVMQEGLANICQITEHQTIHRQAVTVAIPHKRSGTSDYEKAVTKFHSTLLSTLLRHIELPSTPSPSNPPPPLLIASPAFYAANFLKYIKETATSTNNKVLLSYCSTILTAHASSGHMSALAAALASPALRSKITDAKYARETALMDRFYELIRKDDQTAWYGPKEVERAVEKGGVGRGGGVLLISDSLFRSQDVRTRKRWVSLVDRVRDVEGGEVRVLSSLHESGKRLEALGGIAAILTFPIPDLDEDDEDDAAEDGGQGERDLLQPLGNVERGVEQLEL